MIDSKEKNFDAYKKGLFGNKLRTWYGLDDFNKSDYSGYVTLRYSGDVGASNYTAYNVLKVNDKANEFIKNGADPKLMIINESAPDERLSIQGEITKDHNGYVMNKILYKELIFNGLNTNPILAGINSSPNSFLPMFKLPFTSAFIFLLLLVINNPLFSLLPTYTSCFLIDSKSNEEHLLV